MLASDSTIWRARFNDRYDTPQGRSASELKVEYQIRAIALQQKIDFEQEENEQQLAWLEVIQTMIDEALTLPIDIEASKTYKAIRQVMTQTSFLSHPRRVQPSELFCAVQLVSLFIHHFNMTHSMRLLMVFLVPDPACLGLFYHPALWSARL